MSGSDNSGIGRTQNYYLWAFSAIYLFAFTSIYLQIPGLYGDNGVLPVRTFAQVDQRGTNALVEAFRRLPSLVWLGPSVGLSFNSSLEIIALMGMIVSFLQIVLKTFRDSWNYSLLFVLYFSIFQVGQTFMSFQWDILLLEAGFLTVLLAPMRGLPLLLASGPHNALTFWLIRWLLFRLMFASGVVKLTSGCPKWWSLTALDIHFESQCIPTPIAWFAHHFPHSLLKLSVVMTYVIEIIIPFLFFVPIKNLRLISFFLQVLFQLSIILTGNYNFFNLLTIVLCLSILNDDYLNNSTESKSVATNVSKTRFLMPKVMAKLITLFIYFSLTYWTIKWFNIKWISGSLSMSVGFDNRQFQEFIVWALLISISMAVTSLAFNIFIAFFRCLFLSTGGIQRMANLFYVTLYSFVVIFMFSISLVPHISVDSTNSVRLWPIINRWHKTADGYHLVNSYGLFRRMTGVDGRPEIVIEGSNDLNSLTSWKEYHFLYKPGDITNAPKFIIPHQPRLDWQIWFAALDNYQNNPWLLNLCYRLLSGTPEVLDLLDKSRLPFKRAPNFVRVRLYTYRYTGKKAKNWWRREGETEYIPAISKESLKKYMNANGIEPERRLDLSDKHPIVVKVLATIRRFASHLTPTSFICSLFSAALLIAKS